MLQFIQVSPYPNSTQINYTLILDLPYFLWLCILTVCTRFSSSVELLSISSPHASLHRPYLLPKFLPIPLFNLFFDYVQSCINSWVYNTFSPLILANFKVFQNTNQIFNCSGIIQRSHCWIQGRYLIIHICYKCMLCGRMIWKQDKFIRIDANLK